MNATKTRGAAKPYGVDQTGKREYRAWIDHKGKRHTLGTFAAKPEALRIAQGVFHGLHERGPVIAAKGQIGPFPTWHDKAEPDRSVDPVFSLDPSPTNQDVTSAEIRGQCNTKGPPGPTSYGAVYEAKRDRWRAWVNWGRSRRWLGRFATKQAAESAAKQASDGNTDGAAVHAHGGTRSTVAMVTQGGTPDVPETRTGGGAS